MADNYVENVEDHLSVGDEVEVKVLSIADDGKISLSIKKQRSPRRPQHKSNHNRSPQQKGEDFEKKLSNFLKDSEDKLTSIKRQTESRRGGKGSRR